jgi:hypothetical protein
MQKSVHTNKPTRPSPEHRTEPANDKGPKFEPFFVGHLDTTRTASVHLRRFDQKR